MKVGDASNSATQKFNDFGNIEFTHFKALNDSWLIGFGVGLDIITGQSNSMGGNGSSGGGTGDILYFDPGGKQALAKADDAYYGYQTGSASGAKVIRQSNNFSLSLIPAYAFTATDLGYLRLSYNRSSFTSAGGGSTAGHWLSLGELEQSAGASPYINMSGISPPPGGDLCASDLALATTESCLLTTGQGTSSGGSAGSSYFNGFGVGVGYRKILDQNLFFQAEYKYVNYPKNSTLGITPHNQGFVLSLGYKF